MAMQVVQNGIHSVSANHLDSPDDVTIDQDLENGLDSHGPGSPNGEIEGVGASSSGTAVNGDGVGANERVKKKARRLLLARQLSRSSKDGKEVMVNGNNVVQPIRLLKNCRRSRSRYGRGLPKKGGAGGKGVWGEPGSEILGAPVDMKDPNYDSDSLDNGDIELKVVVPELAEEDLRNQLEPVILEYFEHGDCEEVAGLLEEMTIGTRRYMIPQVSVEIGLDHKPSHREMTSVLISDLYCRVLSAKDIAKGFDLLLKNLPDLMLDTPEAPVIVGNFIARAVADDCLPPKFVHSYTGKVECEYARQALHRADTLLTMKHGLVRLDNVWGVGGGTRPVKYLIKKMGLLLEEYLSSGDVQEACRCLQELEVPHFHHELVYEAVVRAVEAMSEAVEEALCKLLKYLYASIVITPDMMGRGFNRVFDDMPDICLDVPVAYSLLERFVNRAKSSGFVSDAIAARMPNKGRKRFVSEGDGGRVKEQTL